MTSSETTPDAMPRESAPTAQRQSKRTAATVVGALLLVAIVAGIFFFTQRQSYAFHGGEFSPPHAAPALNLTDQDGNVFSLADQQGDVVLLYFGYTTCPDLCPTTLSDFLVVKDKLGADADRVEFVLATFDPERDTQARLQEYLGFFDPDFIGLRGDEAQTEAFKRDYGVTTKRVEYPESATGYLIDHTALIYVIDKEGRLRLTFAYGTDPTLIAQDVKYLLNE
jgi:protein SCO1/2